MMKFITAETINNLYHYVIWLDTTKTLVDGSTPNPDWIREYFYALTPPEGVLQADYEAMNVENIKALCQQELVNENAVVLSQQGTTF